MAARRREADSQADDREKEDAAERRQLGRRADWEEKVLQKNSVMVSPRTGSCSGTAIGLDAPAVEAAGSGESCLKSEVNPQKCIFHTPS